MLLTRVAIAGRTCVVTPDPLAGFARVLRALPEAPYGPARIADTAVLHPGVHVGAGCEVGEDTVLFPNVVLYPGTRVGRGCRIHAGSVLGADGFRYDGAGRKVPHRGHVVVGDDVEIGANCTVDRGFLEDTIIGSGCRLDNLVHVGHGVRLGRSVIIAAQTGISGSVTIGDGVLVGGQVGIADHARIEDGARIGAQSGVHGRIPAGETWLGTPAQPIAVMRRVYAVMRYLPEMWRRTGRS